ncbi:hypothetical protein QQ045_028660 [Rhodiola kirilowii]
MEDCMRDSMRKLALWYTKTFKPITTHEELESIMATLGFVSVISPSQPNDGGIGAVAWKEYVYVAGGGRGRFGEMTPRPRLPSPRIDGLHICTYHAFIDAVDFWLEMSDFSDLFHIRGMPLHRVQDRNRKWRKMEEDDSVFVYRDGTLDPATHSLYQSKKKSNAGDGSGAFSSTSAIIRWKRSSRDSSSGGGSSSLFVPLKDIIV